MFNKFIKEFEVTSKISFSDLNSKLNDLDSKPFGFKEFMSKFSGTTLNNGLYRIHNTKDIGKWTSIVVDAFPVLNGRIKCFAYDWLGRQFALDYERLEGDEARILMIDPGTWEILEIPKKFLDFHEEELIDYKDAALAQAFFEQWYKTNKTYINHNECVGYKIPLFIGGDDSIENLELADMEVYWEIHSQLISKIY